MQVQRNRKTFYFGCWVIKVTCSYKSDNDEVALGHITPRFIPRYFHSKPVIESPTNEHRNDKPGFSPNEKKKKKFDENLI